MGSVSANGGKNTIQTKEKGKTNLEIESRMIASGGESSQNTIILDGGVTIGRMSLADGNEVSDRFGVIAQDGGKNTIWLKDTSNEEIEKYRITLSYLNVDKNKGTFSDQRALATTGLFANGGSNDVKVDGDFVLLYRDGVGGKIVATGGGKNHVETNGGFFAVKYDKPSDVFLTRTTNVRNDYNVGVVHWIQGLLFMEKIQRVKSYCYQKCW